MVPSIAGPSGRRTGLASDAKPRAFLEALCEFDEDASNQLSACDEALEESFPLPIPR